MSRKQIEHKAEKLLKESKAFRAPVSLDLVFNHLGLVAQAKALGDASGVLVVEGGRGLIGYNGQHSQVRQRFTMAHEVGHYALHAVGKPSSLFIDKTVFHRNDQSSEGVDKEEIEANQFAAALLMPKPLVEDAIAKHGFDLDDEEDVNALARIFNVSTVAMSIRLQNLHLTD